MKFTHFVLNKRSYATFLLFTLLLSGLQPVQGSWSDNFDDGDLSDWNAYAETGADDHTWDSSSGLLVSGSGSIQVNHLCKETDFKYGNVTVDVYYEVDLRAAIVQIGRVQFDNADSMFLEIVGALGSPHPNTVGFVHRHDEGDSVYNVPISSVDVSGWHTYSIIRNELTIEVYIDGNLEISGVLENQVDRDYSTFCLAAWQDGVVMFDNLIVTDEDANLGISSTDETAEYILLSLAGLTVIGISSIYINRYVKKKDWQN